MLVSKATAGLEEESPGFVGECWFICRGLTLAWLRFVCLLVFCCGCVTLKIEPRPPLLLNLCSPTEPYPQPQRNNILCLRRVTGGDKINCTFQSS